MGSPSHATFLAPLGYYGLRDIIAYFGKAALKRVRDAHAAVEYGEEEAYKQATCTTSSSTGVASGHLKRLKHCRRPIATARRYAVA